jgi:hypothetical protein
MPTRYLEAGQLLGQFGSALPLLSHEWLVWNECEMAMLQHLGS